jgi:hypothetical protein
MIVARADDVVYRRSGGHAPPHYQGQEICSPLKTRNGSQLVAELPAAWVDGTKSGTAEREVDLQGGVGAVAGEGGGEG